MKYSEIKRLHKRRIIPVIFFSLFLLTGCSGNFDKELKNASMELNKVCPFMVDSETQLDNTVALPDRKFQYNYTLVNISIEEVDTKVFSEAMEPFIIESVQKAEDMKIFRDNDVTLFYNYRDKDGKTLYLFEITPDKYK